MAVYKRGKTWWYEFVFAGQRIRSSAKTRSKTIAIEAERSRRRELESGYHNVRARLVPKLFSVAAQDWLTLKKPVLSLRSIQIEETNLKRLLPTFGSLLVTDIRPEDISEYQQERLRSNASPKTINLEIGTVRAILRRNKVWAAIQQDVRMLPTRDDVGKALTVDEQNRLLTACLKSRSRALYPFVELALHTAGRDSDLRLLTWAQVSLSGATVQIGRSKTSYSSGRVIPLNDTALAVLRDWATQFPEREPNHFVFPTERYGGFGDDFVPRAYATDATKPMGTFKTAWQKAKKDARVTCRFHDLRHTACTRMLEAGAAFPVVAAIMGWSAATTIRMSKRYGHIGQDAQRRAVQSIAEHAEYSTTDRGGQETPMERSKPVN